jgi:type I restriction enzyme M protein
MPQASAAGETVFFILHEDWRDVIMSESISQGIPFLELNEQGIKLYKCNDISFLSLKRDGFSVHGSRKKPDQLVAYGKNILIGIEDKADSKDLEIAITQIKDNYLSALPSTRYFIARAGERTRVFFRVPSTNNIIGIGTTLKGKEVHCFGPKVVTGENEEIQYNLSLLAEQALNGAEPANGSIEIQPPKTYYNPLIVKQSTIRNLWQKIFVSTGENAHVCLATFVELLLYKGISDAALLPHDFCIETLADTKKTNSLRMYKSAVRGYIAKNLFPTIANQPGVINGFAFEEQETVFKKVLSDLCDLGNLAQRQLDPDFKRRVIEAFLGSAHKEGTIRNGKHLTPRIIIQAVWEMAEPREGSRIIDPACGVGGFVLEGLNYPYEFDPIQFNGLGIDRDEQMIITAKANAILHLLDKFADPSIDKEVLAGKVNDIFLQAKNNGTGTLGELTKIQGGTVQFSTKHPADYIFTNVPFYVNGVKQIDNSLKDIGYKQFYESCGLGIESRFLKYILHQIRQGNPGIAFVIVTDGVLYRHKDNIRQIINEQADVLGIISLPEGCFQNNNWKTSILIFKKKTEQPEYSPVFLYNIENIGISLDSYRTPIEGNDIPDLKKAWEKRASGHVDDPKCNFVTRDEFLKTARWADLFHWCRTDDSDETMSFQEYIEAAEEMNKNISLLLNNADRSLSDIFALEHSIKIQLGDKEYFKTSSSPIQMTIRAGRLNPGEYPLFSSQITPTGIRMKHPKYDPLLIENETDGANNYFISWNIKGDPCKDVRLHTEPFYVTENRGLITIVNQNIDLHYVLYYLREHLIALGDFSRSNEAHVGKVKNLFIKIPVNNVGEIDLEKQKTIAQNYEQIIKLRDDVNKRLVELQKITGNIDVFK